MDIVAAACQVTDVIGATYQSSTSTSSGAGGASLTLLLCYSTVVLVIFATRSRKAESG